jgi:hypothetical protein
MAHTHKGNLTGRAASTELAEQREWIREEQNKSRHEFTVKYWNAIEKLNVLDPDWEKWFWNRPEQTCGEMLPLILQRIKEFQEKKDAS